MRTNDDFFKYWSSKRQLSTDDKLRSFQKSSMAKDNGPKISSVITSHFQMILGE